MNSLIRTVALNTFGPLDSVDSSQMAPFPTVFALQYVRVHIGLPNCCDKAFNIKLFVDKTFGLRTTLRIPDVDSYNKYIQFGRDLDNSRF